MLRRTQSVMRWFVREVGVQQKVIHAVKRTIAALHRINRYCTRFAWLRDALVQALRVRIEIANDARLTLDLGSLRPSRGAGSTLVWRICACFLRVLHRFFQVRREMAALSSRGRLAPFFLSSLESPVVLICRRDEPHVRALSASRLRYRLRISTFRV